MSRFFLLNIKKYFDSIFRVTAKKRILSLADPNMVFTSDPDDDHYEGMMAYLIREDGKLRIETERHIFGLFTLDVRRETLTEAGFRIHEETYVELDHAYVTFACQKQV